MGKSIRKQRSVGVCIPRPRVPVKGRGVMVARTWGAGGTWPVRG